MALALLVVCWVALPWWAALILTIVIFADL